MGGVGFLGLKRMVSAGVCLAELFGRMAIMSKDLLWQNDQQRLRLIIEDGRA